MTTPTLTTERLVLRPLRASDAPAIQEHFARWSIIQHLSTDVPWPYPEDGAASFIKHRLAELEASEDMTWAITEQHEDELIGLIDYWADSDRSDNRGFWLGEPWHGRGYMTEAIIAVQDYLFLDLKVDRILVLNAIDNLRSKRIKEKTGGRLIGRVSFRHRNGCDQSEQWEVTRESWRQFRGL
jgi:ribosomal-protein-alanine N-acetyltransferase